MEYHNPNRQEDLFKAFSQSIKQNDLEKFNYIKQRLTSNSELTAYFIAKLQSNSVDNDDHITLLYYAVSYQSYVFTKTLLALKASPNEISSMLLKSAPTQSSSTVSYSLNSAEKKHPASLDQEETPLVLAALLKNRDLIYLLISYGADPLIYDATTRYKDFVLREAQQFVLEVRDEWIKAPLLNTISALKSELNMVDIDSDNKSEQSDLSPKPSI